MREGIPSDRHLPFCHLAFASRSDRGLSPMPRILNPESAVSSTPSPSLDRFFVFSPFHLSSSTLTIPYVASITFGPTGCMR